MQTIYAAVLNSVALPNTDTYWLLGGSKKTNILNEKYSIPKKVLYSLKESDSMPFVNARKNILIARASDGCLFHGSALNKYGGT